MRKAQVGTRTQNKIHEDVLKYGYGTVNPDREWRVPNDFPKLHHIHQWFDNADEMAETLLQILNGKYSETCLKQDYEILVRSGRIARFLGEVTIDRRTL